MRKVRGGNDVVSVFGTDMQIICNISALSENRRMLVLLVNTSLVASPYNVIHTLCKGTAEKLQR